MSAAQAKLELYDCPPLNARITAKTCEINKARGTEAAKAKPGSQGRINALLLVDTCPDCPGVRELAAQGGPGPTRVSRAGTKPDEPPAEGRVRRKKVGYQRILDRRQTGQERKPPMRKKAAKKKTTRKRLAPGEIRGREREVYDLKSQGLQNPEIAERLGCSIGAVASAYHGACKKLGVTPMRLRASIAPPKRDDPPAAPAGPRDPTVSETAADAVVKVKDLELPPPKTDAGKAILVKRQELLDELATCYAERAKVTAQIEDLEAKNRTLREAQVLVEGIA